MVSSKVKDKVSEDTIRGFYNKIAGNYFQYRNEVTDYWSLIEWPVVERNYSSWNNKVIVDVGCGSGNFINKIITFPFKKAIGVDISDEMIKICKENNTCSKVDFAKESVMNLPFKDSSIDLITSFNVLHYVEDLRKALSELYRILKSDGKIIFSVRHPIRNMLKGEKEMSDYYDGGWHSETWREANGIEVFSYYRTLESWVNNLTRSGFVIKMLFEPIPDKSVKNIDHLFYKKYRSRPRSLMFILSKSR